MKETALAHMEVPAEAQHLGTAETIENLTRSTYQDSTSSFLRWTSLNYVGLGSSLALGVGATPVYNVAGEGLALTMAILCGITGLSSGISLFIQLIAFDKDVYLPVRDEVAKKSDPISPDEWKKSKGMVSFSGSYGIRIRSRSVKNALVTALLPARIFKKKLVCETVWYDPRTDTFTRESDYMGFAHYTKKIETFAGRRQAFNRALDSL